MKKFYPMCISALRSASIGIIKQRSKRTFEFKSNFTRILYKSFKQKKSAGSALFFLNDEETILTVEGLCTTDNLEDFVGNSRLTCFIVAQFEVFLKFLGVVCGFVHGGHARTVLSCK